MFNFECMKTNKQVNNISRCIERKQRQKQSSNMTDNRNIVQLKYPGPHAPQAFYHNNPMGHPEYPLFVGLMRALNIPNGIIDYAWQHLLYGFYLQDDIQHQLEWLEIGEGIALGQGTRNEIRNDNYHFEQLAIQLSDYLNIGDRDLALWSGGVDLSDYAFMRGYTPLERTPLGLVLNQIEFHSQWILQAPLWNIISRVFVRQGPVNVHVFLRTFEADSVLFRQEIPAIREIFPNAYIRWHAIYTSPDGHFLYEIDNNLQLVANYVGFQSEDLCVQTLMEYYASHPNANTIRGLNTLLANVDMNGMPGVH